MTAVAATASKIRKGSDIKSNLLYQILNIAKLEKLPNLQIQIKFQQKPAHGKICSRKVTVLPVPDLFRFSGFLSTVRKSLRISVRYRQAYILCGPLKKVFWLLIFPQSVPDKSGNETEPDNSCNNYNGRGYGSGRSGEEQSCGRGCNGSFTRGHSCRGAG